MDIVERLRKAQQTFYGDTSINELHMYAADEIERLQKENAAQMKYIEAERVIRERLDDEIERLRIHYDGTIMYGNRLVDLIEWAEKNGIDFPAKLYNPCVIAFEHFRNERERLKEDA